MRFVSPKREVSLYSPVMSIVVCVVGGYVLQYPVQVGLVSLHRSPYSFLLGCGLCLHALTRELCCPVLSSISSS